MPIPNADELAERERRYRELVGPDRVAGARVAYEFVLEDIEEAIADAAKHGDPARALVVYECHAKLMRMTLRRLLGRE